MTLIQSIDDLAAARAEAVERQRSRRPVQIRIAMGSCSIAAGARDTLQAFQQLLSSTRVEIIQTGCNGLCALEPVVEVCLPEQPPVTYGQVTPEVARKIVHQHLQAGLVVAEYLIEND